MPKKKKQEKYPAILWTQIRALYESGLYTSLAEVHKAAQQLYKKIPSFPALRARCTAEKWDRHGYKERLEAAHETAITKLFAQEGLDERETVRRVVAGVKHSDALLEKVTKKLDESKGALTPELLETVGSFLKDMRIQLAFIRESNRMRNLYKNTGATGDTGGDTTDDLTYDELMQEHERLTSTIKR